MTSQRTWPKPDLLQQRRIEIGLPLEPLPVSPLFSLVLKGAIAGVVLVMLACWCCRGSSIVSRWFRLRSMHSIPSRSVLVMPKHGSVP